MYIYDIMYFKYYISCSEQIYFHIITTLKHVLMCKT